MWHNTMSPEVILHYTYCGTYEYVRVRTYINRALLRAFMSNRQIYSQEVVHAKVPIDLKRTQAYIQPYTRSVYIYTKKSRLHF